MPLWQARKLCPNLIVLRPNFDRYRASSRSVFQLLANITSSIEPVSIDEGYLDITNCSHLGNPIEIANNIQKEILEKLGLPCSIGIGPNKFLAKTASDMKKPLGITVLRKRDLPAHLWPLSVDKMYGVGKKTAGKLATIQIETIGDLAQADVYQLKQLLGINGERLRNRANGIDPRQVDPDAVNEFKSIGSSQTLPFDTTDEMEIDKLMDRLANNIAQRMQRREVAGISIQITIRYYDRQTITRSRKLQQYIDQHSEILAVAKELFQQHWNSEPIRLLGIAVQDIDEKQNIAKQLDLFTYEQQNKTKQLDTVVKKLSNKYGENTFMKLNKKEKQEPFRTSFQKDFLDDFLK